MQVQPEDLSKQPGKSHPESSPFQETIFVSQLSLDTQNECLNQNSDTALNATHATLTCYNSL